MASDSVSFRITRSTEDLAQTIHALSHRLVRLEQRFSALELAVQRVGEQQPVSSEQLSSLDHVERLLHDCRSLLEGDDAPVDDDAQHPLAA
jgi:hypothetical protein